MKTHILRIYALSAAVTLSSLCLFAQDEDSVISRNVVVERDFRPVIQDAGKLNTRPAQVETTVEPVEVRFSDYSQPLNTAFNVTTLPASSVTFNRPQLSDGWLEVGGGWPLTRLDFNYRIRHKKDIVMNLFARHNGQWGQKTWSNSTVGMDFVKRYSSMDVYFLVDGNNTFYTRYGRYFDGDNKLSASYSDFRRADKQHLWEVNTAVGVRSRVSEGMQYRAQIGYSAFIMPSVTSEHMLRTHLDLAWKGDPHTIGGRIFVQDAFYVIDKTLIPAGQTYNSRHAIRFEPFYEYDVLSWLIHTGVNIDMNIGKGRLFSANDNLSFAPSPNVSIEYRIVPSWIALYLDAKGSFGTGTLQAYTAANPYLEPVPGVTSHHVSSYVPVEASLGMKMKPVNTLFINIYGRFAHMRNQTTFCAPTLAELKASPDTWLSYFYSDYNRWNVGAEFTWHYQDIVHILLAGNWYYWQQLNVEVPDGFSYDTKAAFDRPSWDLHFRVDANIDSKWSLYSDNIVAGSRKALLTDGTSETLKPLIDLRLGVRYNINRWLYCYAQLNNFLHRHNDIFYGYQSQGINGMVGIRWQF
jgi:hypothetical protein